MTILQIFQKYNTDRTALAPWEIEFSYYLFVAQPMGISNVTDSPSWSFRACPLDKDGNMDKILGPNVCCQELSGMVKLKKHPCGGVHVDYEYHSSPWLYLTVIRDIVSSTKRSASFSNQIGKLRDLIHVERTQHACNRI